MNLRGYLGIAIIVLTVMGAMIVKARAHGWYDPVCCSGHDCAPALKIEQVELTSAAGKTVTLVTTIHGTKPITEQTRILESKDSQSHGCIYQGALICLYVAPGN